MTTSPIAAAIGNVRLAIDNVVKEHHAIATAYESIDAMLQVDKKRSNKRKMHEDATALVYMPKKMHAGLKRLVKMCVEKDVGFDFLNDSRKLPFTTNMLVRISEEYYMHVCLSAPDEWLLEGFYEEIRMNIYTKYEHVLLHASKYRVITVDEFDEYISQTKSPV